MRTVNPLWALGAVAIGALVLGTGIWRQELGKANAAQTPTGTRAPRPQAPWLIESWQDGTITAVHEGLRYQASCDTRGLFSHPDLPETVTGVPIRCDLAIDLVGQSVQGLEGQRRDADGWVVSMWNAGQSLVVKRWKDDHTPYRQDAFVITSVKPAR